MSKYNKKLYLCSHEGQTIKQKSMKPEKKNQEEINDVAITIEVDNGAIDRVRKGETTHIGVQINEDNQNLFLEHINGHLILVTEEMPNTYHGCYLYNGGEFPYAIKDSVQFFVLSDGTDDCLVKILSVETTAGTRFRFQGPGKPSVEDPNGDSCIWEVGFEIVPVLEEPRKYLMRWNPSISSFTEEDYRACVENMEHGMFRINWSIFEWEEARRGDMFYMLRVGDNKAGIAFSGLIVSDPYVMDDWAGSSKRRLYVDLVCMNAVAPDDKPIASLKMLQAAIPEFNWAKGHSGVLLPDNVAEKIAGLIYKDAPLLN